MQVDHTLTQLQVSDSPVPRVGDILLDLAAAAAVQNLKTQIAAVESLIAIDLDNRRNELVALNLVGNDCPSTCFWQSRLMPHTKKQFCGIQAQAISSACRLF